MFTKLTPLQLPILCLLFAAGSATAGNKVKICHIPKGEPNNSHTIIVSEKALKKHLAHGDFFGECETIGYPFSSDYATLDPCTLSDGARPSVDWTTRGVVTPIMSAGEPICKSEWATAVVSNISMNFAIISGTLTRLSAQELIDCDTIPNSCESGNSPVEAMAIALDHEGLCSESSYSYTDAEEYCQEDTCGTKYNRINGYCGFAAGDEESLKRAVSQKGGVTIVLNVGDWLDNYSGGIAQPAECGTEFLAAVLVGYGESEGVPYWKVKVEKGRSWGENGYLRIVRGSNACGIADYTLMPLF